jgi:hypothetical protein
MLVLLIRARSIIPKSNKHIWFKQYHILMYVRNSSKKRKYLIIKLFDTSSSNRSLYMCGCRYSGCINRCDVLIGLVVVVVVTSSWRLWRGPAYSFVEIVK